MSKLHESIKVSAVEFFEFIFVIGFALLNFNLIAWGVNKGENIVLFSGAKVLDYFIILTGVYLASTYRKLVMKNTKKISTWKYVKENLVNYYPAILSGVLLVFIVRNAINMTSIMRLPKLMVGSLLEFFGLSQIGLVNYMLVPSNIGLNTAVSAGAMNILWNEPLSYMSAMIIAGLFLFYAISHNEDLYKHIICPLAVIVGYGTLGLLGEYSSINANFLGISSSLIRSISGMALGSLIYYIAVHFKEKKIHRYGKSLLTIINVFLLLYFVCSFIYGNEWNDFINIIFIVPFIFLNLLGNDYLSEFLDNKISIYFGQLALYIFATHIAFVYLVPYLFPNLAFTSMALVYVLFCFIWANIMYLFDLYVITPLFR